MCRVLYLGTRSPLPEVDDDPAYPELAVRAVERLSSVVAALLPKSSFVYEVGPARFCGCYFRIKSARETDEDLEDARASRLGLPESYRATTALYPGLPVEDAVRRFEADRRRAVLSFADLVSSVTPAELYVTDGGEVVAPHPTTRRLRLKDLAGLAEFDPGQDVYWELD